MLAQLIRHAANLYYLPVNGVSTPQWPNHTTWDQWHTKGGNDRYSIVADPLFVDAAGGDYRLQQASPARALGIEGVDQCSIGTSGNAFSAGTRPSWC